MAGSVGVVGGGGGDRCCEGGGDGGGGEGGGGEDRGVVQVVEKGSDGEVGEKGRPVGGVGGRRVQSTLQSVVKIRRAGGRITHGGGGLPGSSGGCPWLSLSVRLLPLP